MKTGLDHIKDRCYSRSVLPIFDYASVNEETLNEPQYNWGYDPKISTFQKALFYKSYEPTVE